jgi:hypothetical protein
MFSSCSREDDQPFELFDEELVGTWEQYQYEGSVGSGSFRTPYEPTGIRITFLSNGKLRSESFFQCSEGEFKVADEILTIQFDCKEEVPERTYLMAKEGEDLVLSPRTPFMCIEGCSYIFKKI